MSYHRNEVDGFLDYNKEKINTRIDSESTANEDYWSVKVELQFQDALDPRDIVISEAMVEVEYDDDGKLETTSLEIVNQDPEFFMDVLQAKYDKEGEGQQVDLENGYDEMFMEATAGRVVDDIEYDLEKLVRYSHSLMELDPKEEGDEIEFEILSEGNMELIEGTENTYHFMYDVTFGDDANGVAFRVTPSEDGNHMISHFDENEQHMNADVGEKIKASFGIKYDEQKVEEFIDDEVMPKLTETAREAFDDKYKEELNVEPEPEKPKKKKSQNLGMSM